MSLLFSEILLKATLLSRQIHWRLLHPLKQSLTRLWIYKTQAS